MVRLGRLLLAFMVVFSSGFATFYDTSYKNMININVTSTTLNYSNVPLPIILNDSNWGNNSCQDTNFCNDSIVTWFNVTSSLEQSVPYYMRYNATGNTELWVNVSAVQMVNKTIIHIYFNKSSTTPRSTYFNGSKTFIRFYDFENETGDIGSFGAFAGTPRTNTTIYWRGTKALSLTYGTGAQIIAALGATTASAYVETQFKCSANDGGSNMYWGSGTGTSWGATKSYAINVPLTTAWQKAMILLNGTSATGNITIAGVSYSTTTGTDGVPGQIGFPYSTASICYLDEWMYGNYIQREDLSYVVSAVFNQGMEYTLEYPATANELTTAPFNITFNISYLPYQNFSINGYFENTINVSSSPDWACMYGGVAGYNAYYPDCLFTQTNPIQGSWSGMLNKTGDATFGNPYWLGQEIVVHYNTNYTMEADISNINYSNDSSPSNYDDLGCHESYGSPPQNFRAKVGLWAFSGFYSPDEPWGSVNISYPDCLQEEPIHIAMNFSVPMWVEGYFTVAVALVVWPGYSGNGHYWNFFPKFDNVQVYETAKTLWNYSNVSLVYNNTKYPATQLNTSTWAVNLTVPLANVNGTNYTFFWNYTKSNATASIVNQTINGTQSVYYSYSLSNAFNVSSVMEGGSVLSNLQITNGTARATITNVFITVNGSQLTGSYINYNGTINYNRTIALGQSTNDSEVQNYVWTVGLYYGGATRYQNLTTPNLTVNKMLVTFCNDMNITALVYRTYDESNWGYLNNSNYSITVVLKGNNIQRNYSSTSLGRNISVCIPTNESMFTADVVLLYSNAYASTNPYSQRTWYDFNLAITNTTKNINIYLINATNQYLTEIDTRDINNLVASNIMVLAQKFNYSNNKWVNMTSILTNADGIASTWFERYNTPYRFILMDTSNAILNTYNDYFIIDSPITLRTSTTFTNYVTVFQNIQVGCSYSNTTKVLTCSFTDTEEQLTSITFEVVQSGLWGMPTICNETLNDTHSGVFICDLTSVDAATKGFKYRVTGSIIHSPEREYILTWGVIDKPLPSIMGASGVWFALMVWMAIFFIGTWKPTVAIMVSLFGFFVVIWLGLIDFGTAGWELAMGLMVTIALLVMWRLKR